MITSPSADQILEGVLMAIEDEIVPSITNPKAHATAQMIQSLLQGVRQMLPVLDEQLVNEHNDMIRTFREAADALGDASGPAADRIRERGEQLGSMTELPPPLDREAALAAYDRLSRGLEESFRDLDELQRAGVAAAGASLEIIRGHLAPRYLSDVATIQVGEGFVGRS